MDAKVCELIDFFFCFSLPTRRGFDIVVGGVVMHRQFLYINSAISRHHVQLPP